MLWGTAREDCATKDFLSLPKKVLVTLICVICSFFSTARRTNQEAPPLLSGFWVRRYGRRRGLRNSLRSDSPRPFSSVFLATSPPDKGGDFARAFAGLFNPLARWALPLYRCAAQGERFKSVASNILNSSIAVPRSITGYCTKIEAGAKSKDNSIERH